MPDMRLRLWRDFRPPLWRSPSPSMISDELEFYTCTVRVFWEIKSGVWSSRCITVGAGSNKSTYIKYFHYVQVLFVELYSWWPEAAEAAPQHVVTSKLTCVWVTRVSNYNKGWYREKPICTRSKREYPMNRVGWHWDRRCRATIKLRELFVSVI